MRQKPAPVPRSALFILYALKATGKRGATYMGLKEMMGYGDITSVQKAVREARRLGLVRVVHPGGGRGAKAVVYPMEPK